MTDEQRIDELSVIIDHFFRGAELKATSSKNIPVNVHKRTNLKQKRIEQTDRQTMKNNTRKRGIKKIEVDKAIKFTTGIERIKKA